MHHIQSHIIQELVESDTARFSELKPWRTDGNIFSYHLQSLIKDRYVQKTDAGRYQLTNRGKLLGINNGLTHSQMLEQAHSIILLAVRNNKGAWLLRRRLVQPQYGKIGFIHGEPVAGNSVLETANDILKRRTGLTANFSVRGSGFITLNTDGKLESYTHFVLVTARNPKGDLISKDKHGENNWISVPDFDDPDMIPSMTDLVRLLANRKQFFVELEYQCS